MTPAQQREQLIVAAARQWAKAERRLRDLSDRALYSQEEKRAAVARADYSEQILLETVEAAIKEEREEQPPKPKRRISYPWERHTYRPINEFYDWFMPHRYGDLETRIAANSERISAARREGKTLTHDAFMLDMIERYTHNGQQVIVCVPDAAAMHRLNDKLDKDVRPRVSWVIA